LKIPGGNQNPYIKEEQTTQWPKEQVQKDQQRSTKHTYKTKDRVTRNPLNIGSELRSSGWVFSSCSTSDTSRVNLVTNPVISHERGNKSVKALIFVLKMSKSNNLLKKITANIDALFTPAKLMCLTDVASF
jgi:hypothetical protein